MPTLTIGTRRFETDEARVHRSAEQMFRLTPAQREYRIERAKTRLVREADAGREGSVVADAAATLISEGITEI
jgi:hypothetical protein